MAMAWHLPCTLVMLLCLVAAAPTCKGGTLHEPQPQPSTTTQARKLLQSTLYSGTSTAHFYYDLKTECNGEGLAVSLPPADNPLIYGRHYPYCTSTDPSKNETFAQYNTNNVVAIDINVLSANKAGLCGKLIRVYRADGSEVSAPDGGNFFVWDGCPACIGGGRVDFSLSGAQNIDPNACQLDVIPGISFEVLDTQVQPFVP